MASQERARRGRGKPIRRDIRLEKGHMLVFRVAQKLCADPGSYKKPRLILNSAAELVGRAEQSEHVRSVQNDSIFPRTP